MVMPKKSPAATRANVTYEGVASTVAAIAAIVAASKVAQAAEPGTFPPEVIDLLGLMAEDLANINEATLPLILEAIRAIQIGSGSPGYPPNADFIYTGTAVFPAILVAQQLPLVEVPDDFAITIKAYPTNPVGSLVYVATNPADAINPNSSWPLMPNESISYRLKKTDSIHCSASVAPGCTVVWTVELRRS